MMARRPSAASILVQPGLDRKKRRFDESVSVDSNKEYRLKQDGNHRHVNFADDDQNQGEEEVKYKPPVLLDFKRKITTFKSEKSDSSSFKQNAPGYLGKITNIREEYDSSSLSGQSDKSCGHDAANLTEQTHEKEVSTQKR